MKKKRVDRTIMIWDECGQAPIQFLVLDGDHTKFNNIYINRVPKSDLEVELQNRLSDFVYTDKGELKVKFLSKFPLKVARLPFTRVIIAGFLP